MAVPFPYLTAAVSFGLFGPQHTIALAGAIGPIFTTPGAQSTEVRDITT
jgi:hypothetical protein